MSGAEVAQHAAERRGDFVNGRYRPPVVHARRANYGERSQHVALRAVGRGYDGTELHLLESVLAPDPHRHGLCRERVGEELEEKAAMFQRADDLANDLEVRELVLVDDVRGALEEYPFGGALGNLFPEGARDGGNRVSELERELLD